MSTSSKFAGVQQLGRALMLPIAVLPVAGLLLRLGQPDLLGIPVMAQAGDAIFGNLALLFAIGVAVGFAKDNNGASGLAGAIVVPIFHGDEVIGALGIANRGERIFTEEEIDAVT